MLMNKQSCFFKSASCSRLDIKNKVLVTGMASTSCYVDLVSSVQRSRVLSDSPGRVDFAVGIANSVLNLPNGQAKVSRQLKLQKNCIQSCSS